MKFWQVIIHKFFYIHLNFQGIGLKGKKVMQHGILPNFGFSITFFLFNQMIRNLYTLKFYQ